MQHALKSHSNRSDTTLVCPEASDMFNECSQNIHTQENGLSSIKQTREYSKNVSHDSSIMINKRERRRIDYSALFADVDDYGTPLAKKSRGRPKKSDQETFTASTPIVESNPTKKKRGRPRKVVAENQGSPQVFTDSSQNEIVGEISQSSLENAMLIKNVVKRGRAKKQTNAVKVDTLDINGQDNIDDQEDSCQEETCLSQEGFKELDSDSSEDFVIKRAGRPKKKKRGRPRKLQSDESESSSCFLDKITSKSKINRPKKLRFIESDDEINGDTNEDKAYLNTKHLNREHEDLLGTNSDQISSDDEQNLSTLRNKLCIKGQPKRRKGIVSQRKVEKLADKPYKTCTKMLRKMLQQSGSVENTERIEPSAEDGAEVNVENTICMVCKESIPMSEWEHHKSKVHYNLAWHTGEFALDIHDEAVIHENLKNMRDFYDKLECNHCGLLGTRVKDFWQHVEKCVGIISPSGMVTCAVCKESIIKTAWKTHRYKKHNNLAWRTGEPPIDLSDQNLIIHILNKIYKERKPLTCEKCGKSIKSVVGFLSHKSVCQKSYEEVEKLKVVCELCQRKILPVSLESHMKSHNLNTTKDVEEHVAGKKREAANKAMEVISKFVEDSDNSSKSKEGKTRWYLTQDDFFTGVKYRISRMKLEHIKCLFSECSAEFSSSQELADHLKGCSQKPAKFFLCKLCLKVCIEKADILDHLKDSHKKMNLKRDDEENGDFNGNEFDESDSDDGDDFEVQSEIDDDVGDFSMDLSYRKRKLTYLELKHQGLNEKYAVKPNFLVDEVFRWSKNIVYTKAYGWMLEFCAENYSNVNLFADLTNQTQWPLLNCDLLDNFLPKVTQSCDVVSRVLKNEKDKCNANDFEFRKLELFEAVLLHDEDITIFCGGPITALAWLPTPISKKDSLQILAVAILNDMESRYVTDQNYNEPCLIQLWDYGVLENRQEILKIPSLLYSIAVDFGPIWHLEWCPSGCDSDSRLGLLAVAGSDSYVYIFSVDAVPDEQRETILKGRSCLKLALCENSADLENGDSYYATKISWTKASGHRYIAVGYSNGFVGLFNLEEHDQSILRNTTIGGQKVLFSYLKFQPQLASPITVLSLSHLSGGNTWLLTGNFEQDICYWDLRTLNCVSSVKNASPSDGVWMTHWLASTFSDDKDGARELPESNSKTGISKGVTVHATTWSPRECMTEKYPLTYSYSAIKCLSFSDWLNTLIHGNYTGEITANFANQLARYLESSFKTKKGLKNCLFSHAKLVKKIQYSEDIPETVVNYLDTTEKYGLVFCDYDLRNRNFPQDLKRTVDREMVKETNIEPFPLQAINKIAFNPNLQACTYFVSGYNCGLLRLRRLQFLTQENDGF